MVGGDILVVDPAGDEIITGKRDSPQALDLGFKH